MDTAVLEELGVEATLDRIEHLHCVRLDADAEMFELATLFAYQQEGDWLPTDQERSRPGTERSVRLGGVGTPRVAEFACAEFGGRMQLGSWGARIFIADALDVRHRLPLIWAKVVAREARIPWVRLVASKTRHLSVEAAAHVDAAMADFVDGCLSWGRFETRLDGKIVKADPETAAAREAARMAEQIAKRTRSSERGTAGFFIQSSVGVIARIDASVAFVAEALQAFGDTDSVDERRVKAVLVLCNPTKAVELLAAYAALRSETIDVDLPLHETADLCDAEPAAQPAGRCDDQPEDQPDEHPDAPPDALARMDAFSRRVGFEPTRLPDWLSNSGSPPGDPPDSPSFTFSWSHLLPSLTLNLHFPAESLVRGDGGVVRWEGECPVTEQFVHDYLRPLHGYRIQPVIDIPGMAPVDAYEIPDRHRTAVHLRSPADASPFAASLQNKVDDDHTLEYRADRGPGQTRLDNLAGLGRFGHRVKTFGHWTLRQPFSGIMLWRDPHGQIYLVDHTGTHKVTAAGRPAGPATDYDPEINVAAGRHVIEVDFGSHAG